MRSITTLTALALLATTACSKIPPEAYYNNATPELLLDQSSEVVNFDVGSPESVQDMVAWVNQDQPSRAEVYCEIGDPACEEAQMVLTQFAVPFEVISSPEATVTLMYDRILARDCENRYIDNSVNPYNLSHPTYGCSNAVNMLQMVTDKRQFTNPPLLDLPDGERLQRVMAGYRQPYQVTAPRIDPNFRPDFDISR